jgi:secreted PhoX family phosphatase
VHDDSNAAPASRLSAVLAATLSRRRFLAASAAAALLPGVARAVGAAGVHAASAGARIAFTPVPADASDRVQVPRGYRAQVLVAWGDPVSDGPPFRFDASNTAADQALQCGMHHDGMALFPLPGRGGLPSDSRALLCVNHEYVDNGLLFPDGQKTWTAEKVLKAQHAHGVAVLEIERVRRGWRVVRPSRYARRITARTAMDIAGPARGAPAMRTAADPAGTTAYGTLANCAHGQTPWGTYLTCEENFHCYFASTSRALPAVTAADREFTADEVRAALAAIPPDARRYGIGLPEFAPTTPDASRFRFVRWGLGHRWHEHDERFDAGGHPNEPNRFGWVVEIDPFDPASRPVKRTALGRFKHESATVTLAKDGRVVVYSGDDERDEYLYKYVSRGRFDPSQGRANGVLLDDGTLYVARFEADGTGRWLPLVHGRPGLTREQGWLDQGDVLIRSRQAADVVGATRMDRTEWVAVAPNGDAYVSCTNNTTRVEACAANPRERNSYGHVLRWRERDRDPANEAFDWELFVLCGDPRVAQAEGAPQKAGDIRGAAFGSPDGLHVDADGRVWICTDVSTTTLNAKDYRFIGNNQLLCADPETREVRRFLTGPNGCEITGAFVTPDGRALFVNVQHPGEPASEYTDPDAPRGISNWPDGRPDGRPRSATLVVTKDDGGVIGT